MHRVKLNQVCDRPKMDSRSVYTIGRDWPETEDPLYGLRHEIRPSTVPQQCIQANVLCCSMEGPNILPVLEEFGPRICIMGPSNSGKSTLASVVGRARDLPVVHLDQSYREAGTIGVLAPS